MIANVLSIAGSDPSGGAGIQADIKAISANGAFALAAITALTSQNTQGVNGIHTIPPNFVSDQIKTIFDDIRVDAIKIGMIANAEIAQAVAETLDSYSEIPVVLDPVMIAKGGAPLLDPKAVSVVRDKLLPMAQIITPNTPEAATLLGCDTAQNREEIARQARRLLTLGPKAVFLKGGHLPTEESPDCLAEANGTIWFEGERQNTKNTHGTGCTLSAALAAQLAQGRPLIDAARRAKSYVTQAIANADQLNVGHGHGPVHHFSSQWRE